MKNKEKYHDEIMSVALRHSRIALHEGKIRSCDGLSCSVCGFFAKNHGEDIVTCDEYARKWVEQEYKEPPLKLTKRERAFVECFDADFTLIRVAEGDIALFILKDGIRLEKDMFKFVKTSMTRKELLALEVES